MNDLDRQPAKARRRPTTASPVIAGASLQKTESVAAPTAGSTEGSPAPLVSVQRTAVGEVRGDTIDVRQGAVGGVRANEVAVEQGALGLALAGAAKISQSYVRMLVGRAVHVEQSFIRSVIANEVRVERASGVGVLIARRVVGDVRVLVDWRGAAAFGAVAGLVAGLVGRGRRRPGGQKDT
ncbi:MAG TPA: hypothetical protein VKR30_03240 [Candidatus Limnocylindrales bacterium]|nr:hypothetical protein [Candidatus Limnocylindrales bacterium]